MNYISYSWWLNFEFMDKYLFQILLIFCEEIFVYTFASHVTNKYLFASLGNGSWCLKSSRLGSSGKKLVFWRWKFSTPNFFFNTMHSSRSIKINNNTYLVYVYVYTYTCIHKDYIHAYACNIILSLPNVLFWFKPSFQHTMLLELMLRWHTLPSFLFFIL